VTTPVTRPVATPGVDLAALASVTVPPAVVERLRAARHVIAVSHENPDADTLGAVLALCLLVESLGGRATAVCTDPVPPLYAFLAGVERFRTDPDPDGDYDLLILADCATAERVGDIARRNESLFASLPRVTIDHHASNATAAPGDWIDPGAAATCELVTLLAVELGVPLGLADGALAAALMAGIVMDTATFAHPNATPRTLAVSAGLVAVGAPLSDISRRLYRTKPDAQLRLFGRVLGRLDSSADGLVTWSTLLDADFAATGAIPAHSEGIIDLLAQSETAEVAMVVKEQPDGTSRLSVRTKPGGVDATVLTGRFGGGGHTRAAGATIRLPLAEATAAAVSEAERLASEVRR
jgi:phosphoesterase RecJ-like protein